MAVHGVLKSVLSSFSNAQRMVSKASCFPLQCLNRTPPLAVFGLAPSRGIVKGEAPVFKWFSQLMLLTDAKWGMSMELTGDCMPFERLSYRPRFCWLSNLFWLTQHYINGYEISSLQGHGKAWALQATYHFTWLHPCRCPALYTHRSTGRACQVYHRSGCFVVHCFDIIAIFFCLSVVEKQEKKTTTVSEQIDNCHVAGTGLVLNLFCVSDGALAHFEFGHCSASLLIHQIHIKPRTLKCTSEPFEIQSLFLN